LPFASASQPLLSLTAAPLYLKVPDLDPGSRLDVTSDGNDNDYDDNVFELLPKDNACVHPNSC